MSKAIIFGSRGQIGTEISTQLKEAGWEVVELHSGIISYTSQQQIQEIVKKETPDVVVNCVAYTNVDGAEREENLQEVYALNVWLPTFLTEACTKIKCEFIHYSTDYVFDGSKILYSEESQTNPLNMYGKTKLIGECIALSYSKTKVFRVQSVYSNTNKNFYKAISSRVDVSKTMNVVDDQIMAPTSAGWIAKQTIKTIGSGKYGLYNLVPDGMCSFADFAEEIVDGKCTINRISYRDWGSQTSRPLRTIMSNNKFKQDFGHLEHWTEVFSEFKSKLA